MIKDIIEEKTATLEKSLNKKFNKVVKALIQNINGKISERERIDICNKMNQDGINEIRQTLNATAQIVAREVLRKVRGGSVKLDVGTDQRSRRWIELPDLERHLQSLEEEIISNSN
jgi:predicted transcriptional regulator